MLEQETGQNPIKIKKQFDREFQVLKIGKKIKNELAADIYIKKEMVR